MGRPKRTAPGGLIYHVLNRANARMTIFKKDEDYEAMQRIMLEAVERTKMRILAYCLLPNHWHFVLWPRKDGQLSQFTGWLTLTHTQRWHAHRNNAGSGHVYQGRFKSFPVQEDEYFFSVCRYVERNALRANLVERAEDWRWSSLYCWKFATAKDKKILSRWPIPRRPGWIDYVNEPQSDAELSALQRSILRSCSLGDDSWSNKIANKLSLESTRRPQGRPQKHKNGYRGRDRRCRRPPAQIRT